MADAISVALTDIQQVVGHVGENDAAGNPVDVAGITATSSDESIVTVTARDDGLVTIVTVGPTGTATVNIADAEDNLSLDVNVAVGSSAPVSANVTFDPPSDRDLTAPTEPPPDAPPAEPPVDAPPPDAPPPDAPVEEPPAEPPA